MTQSIGSKRTADEADMDAEAADTRSPLQRQLETWLGGFPIADQHKIALMLLDGTVRLPIVPDAMQHKQNDTSVKSPRSATPNTVTKTLAAARSSVATTVIPTTERSESDDVVFVSSPRTREQMEARFDEIWNGGRARANARAVQSSLRKQEAQVNETVARPG